MEKKIKVGFWGNANNYPFMLAKAFKKLDHEVTFIVDDDNRLNRPENRYADISTPYPSWIKDYSPLPLWLVSNPIDQSKIKAITEELNKCDLVFLNGYAVRFAGMLEKQYMVLLTGSDLDPLAKKSHAKEALSSYLDLLYEKKVLLKNSPGSSLVKNNFLSAVGVFVNRKTSIYTNSVYFTPKSTFYNIWFIASYRYWLQQEIKKQRNAIKNAVAHFYFIKGLIPAGDRLLKEIGADEKKRLFNMMVDADSIPYSIPPENKKFRVFNLARMNWVKGKSQPTDFSQVDYKGTDIMLRGIALFIKKNPAVQVEIILVKKGKDVNAAMALCDKLDISSYINWLNELTQKEVLEEYKKADVIFDQLDKSVVAMGGFEAMAIGRPLIANARPEVFDAILGEKTAICQAENAEEVCSWLERLYSDKSFKIETGKKSRDFVIRHFSPEAVVNRTVEFLKK